MSDRASTVIRDPDLEAVLKQIKRDIDDGDYQRALLSIVSVLQTELNTTHRNIFTVNEKSD